MLGDEASRVFTRSFYSVYSCMQKLVHKLPPNIRKHITSVVLKASSKTSDFCFFHFLRNETRFISVQENIQGHWDPKQESMETLLGAPRGTTKSRSPKHGDNLSMIN